MAYYPISSSLDSGNVFRLRSGMDEMTIADLANALRGIPRDALVLIDTPDGPRRLCMVAGSHVADREGRMVRHSQSERYAVILQAER